MLNNNVARDFNLEKMLVQLFTPFHMPPQWVKRVQSLYMKYAQARKGTLYQIGVPKDQARSMSYPSVTGGILNKLGDDADIISIVDTLTTEAQDNKPSRASNNYIQKLQARLLASPGLEMKVQKISISDANHAEDLQLSAGLRQLMTELMYQSHLQTHMGNPAEERGVCKFYPDILQQNQIPHHSELTDERLAAMIHANDAVRVRELITDNLDILKREVSIKKNHYINNHDSSDEKISVLDLILFESGMNAAELGEDFENIAGDFLPEYIEKFLKIMSKISAEGRLAYVLKRINDYQYDLLDTNHYAALFICYS